MTGAEPTRHRLHEDALAILLGTLFVSFGMLIYAKATLLVGSMAGLALLIHYAFGLEFGLLFFVLNIPFYVLAVVRLGWGFGGRTVVAVALVSLFSRFGGRWVAFEYLDPIYATALGGGLIGVGLLILFRHRTGVGGIQILALYLQERHCLRAGWFQLGIDFAIMTAALFVVPFDRLPLSIAGATIVNVIVAINHRPGRYLGVT